MKNMKKVVALIVAIAVIASMGAVFADVLTKSPAEIVSGLTGKSLEAVNKERVEGKAYGTIAKDVDKLDEFTAQMLASRKAMLDERVKAGTLTQAQADQILTTMENRQAQCDGAGAAGAGRNCGGGLGRGQGQGKGQGQGLGMRNGSGAGCGFNNVTAPIK